ncbi:PREDICTED: agrin [Sturnus vulgaris]|uniref:agrin n=1 Tax=Sturnus vulgaris TaxID=9172 RepID=UPI00071A69F4|nr:PREDICTED: agrin [Sturnus vulgaris]
MLIQDPKLSEEPHQVLNLKEPLFVGGAPDLSRLARAAAISEGFEGALQRISLGGVPVLQEQNIRSARDVSPFRGHPCSHRPGPCHHGGSLIIEKAAGDAEAVAFDGHTYLEYHNGVTKSHLSNEIPA